MQSIPPLTWPVVMLFVIGALIRLLKSGKPILSAKVLAKLPKWATSNPRLRPFLAILIGVAYASIEKWRSGEPWKQALIHAAIAGLGPIVVHEVGVESLRGGNEIGGGPPNDAPKPPSPLVTISGAILALCLSGCSLFGGGAQSPTLDLKDPVAMRAALASGANGVLDAWSVCRDFARSMGQDGADRHDAARVRSAIGLAKDCESEYEHARESLMLAQSILDVYENAFEGRVACAALVGFDGIKHIEGLVSQFSKLTMPKSVTDAEQMLQRLIAALVAPMCPVPTASTTADVGPPVADAGADAAEGG